MITGLTLYNGAVIAEIVRAGINALPRGQSEAASALGLSWGQTMRAILLPQAVTSMLPVLISQMVVVLKDTAIGYQITFLGDGAPGHPGRLRLRQLHPRTDRHRRVDDHRQLHAVTFAVWLEGRMRRSRRTPEPMHIQPVTQGTFAAGGGGSILNLTVP